MRLSPEEIAGKDGFYRLRDGGLVMKIDSENGALRVVEDDDKTPLLADGKGQFVLPNLTSVAYFEPAKGSAKRLVIEPLNSPSEIWDRLPEFATEPGEEREYLPAHISAVSLMWCTAGRKRWAIGARTEEISGPGAEAGHSRRVYLSNGALYGRVRVHARFLRTGLRNVANHLAYLASELYPTKLNSEKASAERLPYDASQSAGLRHGESMTLQQSSGIATIMVAGTCQHRRITKWGRSWPRRSSTGSIQLARNLHYCHPCHCFGAKRNAVYSY